MAITLNGTTGIAGANGSASTPAVQGEDTNTGVFFPAADTVAVATGGSERMRVDSSGNLGLGYSSPRSVANYRTLALGGTSNGGLLDMVNGSGSVLGTWYSDSSGSLVINADPNGAFTTSTIQFQVDGAERARIDSNGNLLVGKTASGVTVSTGLEINTNGTTMTSTANAAGAANFYHVYNLNATNNGYRFYVQVNGGIANFSANNVNLSDERAKTDIAPLGSYWDKIKALEVVTYKYRDQSHEDDNIGVIAQQVESVAPEFVSNDGFGETPADGVPFKSIYEADLHYATLKALQEAMARIEALEAKLEAAQ
jgi:hypothetical protein